MTVINERLAQVLPKGVSAEAFVALHHEVTDQFPAEPGRPPKFEPRPAKQLPPGVTAEDMIALSGEQP